MRILLLSPEFRPPGGIQYVGRLIAEALHAGCGPGLMLDAIGLHDDRPPPLTFQLRSWTGCHGSRWRFIRTLSKTLRHTRHDLVLLNHVGLLPYLTAAPRNPPDGMLVIHGIEAWKTLPRWRLAGLRHVSRLMYVSDYSRRAAEGANPAFRRLPGVVCHNALGPAESLPGEVDPPGRAPQADFALMIGRITRAERYKGHEAMIRAWPKVQAARPGLELWIIGDGDDGPRLRKLAKETSASVRFLGQVSDAERDRLLEDCRCLCLPSRGEGFGLVYLEAMRVAKPVLAGALDAGAEVVVDRETGRTADADDQGQLIEAILDVTSERGPMMGIAGRERFQRRFTFEAYVQRLMECVSIASPHAGAPADDDISARPGPCAGLPPSLPRVQTSI